jgi:hypothetical protein
LILKVKSKIVYRIGIYLYVYVGVQLVVNKKIIDDNAFKNIDFVDLYEWFFCGQNLTCF